MASFSSSADNSKRHAQQQIGRSSRSVYPDGKSSIRDKFQNPCAFHAKGWCIRANSCSFPHIEEQGPPARVDERGHGPIQGVDLKHHVHTEHGRKQHNLFEDELIKHIKEVLEKLWVNRLVTRNGFRMTVKKSVTKIMNSFKPGDIPSSRESIESYIDLSREKIEKLVLAYAGIYRNL